MKVEFPGLIIEKLPSGNSRLRVRVEGDKARRIRLHVDLDHKDFLEHYRAARQGVALKPDSAPEDRAIRGSIAWLVAKYLAALAVEVEREEKRKGAGIKRSTFRERSLHLGRLCEKYGEFSIAIPQTVLIEYRDSLSAKPAAADGMIKTIRAMYSWAVDRGLSESNPAKEIKKIHKGFGGATAWSVADLKQYRDKHPPGTMPHLALTLFLFTGCRIGDAVRMGTHNEQEFEGVQELAWQPEKTGSAYVCIPMLPPLLRAIIARQETNQSTYILTKEGLPYGAKSDDEGAGKASFDNQFRKWCHQAGLKRRSSHGIRKAAANILAEAGCTQHQIMAVLGHTEAKTSDIYTKAANRRSLARDAYKNMEGFVW